ncbi:uncharacterized protein [Physcomitrium patens]|uniref:Enhancer of polycomb-like protein n=1 Tax=Physcomitrium patens TaxID=3218 RepID=A0A2K1KBN0_PHYPA|nr:uncharacterized protein LOC112284440 isoform X1 [Physcomitrium patens]XP_024379998.1 uncharacterized protein LOC112284440 isoform X1 [Physcomitrium patens]PNR51184.1 hypothetical protein PHYPA_010370 [Physcomitrium patens]|eukprot:XP_024379996.1 uncharacterized protein LOC112284440 isoform X1 [Physcomitrella patens]
MEAKAVTSGMTAMPRRSREHRSTKNVETIQEASDSQLDIASTSKNSKAGILSSSDALLHRKDLGDSSNLRRSSRVCRSSQMSKVAFSSKTLEARANGAKVLMHGVSDISPASSSGKTPAVIGVASEVLKLWVNVEAGQGASSLVQPSHVANSNETSTPLGSGCTSDAAGQPNGRPLRGRPRGRHVTPAKKIARRAKRLQEVPLSESDGPRILGRRIKIFWRDENRWFYGVVKAYNRGRRSHKIVYDDKEEEWVKLHEEIFKLQVLEGEVFGEQQQAAAAAAQPAQVASIFAKNVSSIEKGRNMNHQEFSSGEIAGSANGGIQASALTNSTHVPPSLLQGSESSLELPGVRFDGEFRDQGSSIRDDAFNTRAIQESEDALPMVCENVDPEDPYAIDHTSISDSLVMFMRSKQNLAESRKVPATSGVMPPSQPAAVGASSIEVFSSVEPVVGNEVKGHLETSDVSPPSPDATEILADHLSSEGCTTEERRAPEGIFFEDEKSSFDSESLDSAKGGDVDSTPESVKQNLLDACESSEVGGVPGTGQGRGVCESGENFGLSNVALSSTDLVVCVRGKEKRVSLESRENHGQNPCSDIVEIGNRVAECFVCREVGVYLGGSASMKGPASKIKSVPKFLVGNNFCDIRQLRSTRLLRNERFISRYIGTNLVNVDCTIARHHLPSWWSDLGNVWRIVPYLTLFVAVVLESGCSQENPCAAEFGMKGPSSTRGSLSVFNIGHTCFSPSLGTAKLVLNGARTSLNGSNGRLLLQQDHDLEVLRGHVEVNRSSSESLCAKGVTFFAQPCEPALVEQPCDPVLVDQACEPMLVERAALSVVRPVLEDLDRGGERSHQEGFIEINDGSFPRNDEVVAFESHPAAPRTYCAENDARDTIVGVEAGSAGGLTEVQIGIAVDGEEDSTIACWRSWASVKRGFSQITPDEMRSYGLGTVSRLLDSELGSIALTKRQKVHVESLSSTDFENGNDDGTKNTLLVGCETNGDMNIRSVETKDSDSVLPRVNVLKLRKCSTGKGGWRIAGNSCVADRTVRQSGDGGEPMTPSSTADRKRPFSQCSEFNQLESPEENGHPGPFIKGSHTNGQDTFHADGANEVKVPVKGMWSNCEVSSINDASFNSRKRFKNGSTNSGSSDDSYAPHFRAEETCRSRNSTEHVYPDSVCHGCIANVLVVQNDRGWREYGASIELQSCHGQGWMLIISVRGENMYAYKAEQAIVTGTTNRHNHAIVWKGGKGWNLEFEDKKQWQVFKELHEECYRRNSKASSGRQIPIPGVRHIEDIAPRSPGCHFMRPNSRYICRVEDEVEMALGNSRVMYDMDSEDEQWLEQINTERANARGTLARPLIAEETLERLLDKLEKEAYLYQQEHKDMNLDPSDVAAESCNGLATQEVIKVIYSYWLDKRTRKGTPLVRQFQPPAWVLYQKQLQQWEQEIARLQLQHPSASMQQLTEDKKKPPLFAFCLRPRGLEAQHKLSKQKSHRKQALPGTAPRQWVGFGSMDGSLHSPRGRQYYTEPAHGLLPAPRRPGRPRLTEEVGANLNGSFNAIMREPATLSGAMSSMQLRNEAFNEYAHRRAGKNKKVGRKARRQRLLAAAQESRRKRLLMRSVGSGELHRQPDLALAAARARSTAEAARARAQALYAVADAAMHKAVAAVIAADALHAAELHENTEEEELPSKNRNLAVVPTYGSWRRAVPGSVLGGLGAKGIVNRQVLESDGEDALLPVASWSQELGAGLGTRLLNKDARVEDIISTRSVHARSPSINVGLGRTRGESTVAMLTR